MDILGLADKAKEKGAVLNKGTKPEDLCPACRRNGRVYCPHKSILSLKAEMAREFDKTDFFGPSPPNIFVGHHGYPMINWGPTVSLNESIPDNPKFWYGWGFDAIVKARSTQVRGKVNSKAFLASKSPGFHYQTRQSRMLCESQDSAMSYVPVDVETHFSKKPNLDVSFHSIQQPMGPSAPMESLSLAENPKIPKKVDSVVDEGLKSKQALIELMNTGYDEHYLTRLLTAGVLGQKSNRRLVPTRWGITAVDDTLAKEHIKKIRDMQQNNDFLIFQNEYLANRFTVVMLPGAFEYENFEAWIGDGYNFSISQEHEPHDGRKGYAFKQGGGYYAARIGVTEALANKIKRQARVIVFREILPEYDLPVGCWQIRQSVREAMAKRPLVFGSREELLKELIPFLKLPLSEYIKQSTVLNQRKLVDF